MSSTYRLSIENPVKGEEPLWSQDYESLTDLREDIRAFQKAAMAGESILPGQNIMYKIEAFEDDEPRTVTAVPRPERG